MNILEAISDASVFGGQFRDPASWAAWRAFLASLCGLPLDASMRRVFRACTARERAPRRGYNEAWLICGRGAGKSFVLALVAVFLSCFRDWRGHLGPGERATVMIIATDRRQARVIMRYVKGLLHSVPMLRSTIERETAEGVDVSNRVTLEVHACSFRSTRGYGIAACLLDEIAFWPTEDAAEPDQEIIAAIRPGLARVPGSMLLCASSPHSKNGALYDAYAKHFGKESSVLVWKAATRTMNPTIPKKVIDAALLEDPDKNRSEYLAEFRADLASFISREQVLACVDTGVRERHPMAGLKYVSFVDPSGGSVDAMTAAVAHKEGNVVVIDALREIKAPFDPESAVEEFVTLFRRYGVRRTNGDRYAAQWCVQAFEKKGIQYRHSEAPRTGLYLDLLPHLNSKTIKLLDVPRAVNQIASLERRTSRGARDSIDHPSGQHDDLSNAVAGVSYVLTNTRAAIPPAVAHYGDLTPRAWRKDAEAEAARNVQGGSRPCLLDPKALEPKPLPDGLSRRVGAPIIWSSR